MDVLYRHVFSFTATSLNNAARSYPNSLCGYFRLVKTSTRREFEAIGNFKNMIDYNAHNKKRKLGYKFF